MHEKSCIANFADIHGGDASAIARILGVKTIPNEICDFSVNVNTYGPPQSVKDFLSSLDFETCVAYPKIGSLSTRTALANAHEVDTANILLGNGSTELFSATISALSPKKILFAAPCYSGYEEICRIQGLPFEYLPSAKASNNFTYELDNIHLLKGEFLFICNPNNPTGAFVEKKRILTLVKKFKSSFIGVDESFIDYHENPSSASLFSRKTPDNLIIFKSLTKFFGIAGLRLGMLCASKRRCEQIHSKLVPWNVNSIAQKVGSLLYSDKNYLCEIRKKNIRERDFLAKELSKFPLDIFQSKTNFLLCRTRKDIDKNSFLKFLFERAFLLRDCSNIHGLEKTFIRIAVLGHDENTKLINAIALYFKSSKKKKELTRKTKAKALMIVGTSSDSGKSLVTATLCRILTQNGLRVAPFKAQNMALNSFVTKSGGEIGRAQAFQAKCAGIDAENDMNPVLLKPCDEGRCQVIVNGKVFKTLSAVAYYEINDHVKKKAFEAYDRLANKYDIIVLEGAGSPTEINLLHRDFVNMAMADYAGADVILVADIDRGGVFASIYGTIRLLPEKWRKLFKGIIINKFRGDERLLESGIRRIEELTGIKVLGVLPYAKGLKIEEEDSLALENRKGTFCSDKNIIDIVVVKYPRISNYTDFLVFEKRRDCNLRYAENIDDIGEPDIIFLPGSKNTIADLNFLTESKIANKILEYNRNGGAVFGICGGYQILGTKISDPFGVEGEAGESKGLSLLDLHSVLRKKKRLSQLSGKLITPLPFLVAGTRFSGYEIHMGDSVSSEKTKILSFDNKKTNTNSYASISKDGLVFGTYVHGFFDEKEIADGLIKWLRKRKGAMPTINNIIDDSFEKFCDIFKQKIKYQDLLRSQHTSQYNPCVVRPRRP